MIGLRYYRQVKGWTQGGFSQKLKVSQGQLSRIEHGWIMPNPKIKRRCERVLGIPKEKLFSNSIRRKGKRLIPIGSK